MSTCIAATFSGEEFEIQRSIDNDMWEAIAFVEGNGTTTEYNNYSYVDDNLITGRYRYKLKQIDINDKYNYSNVVEVEWRAFNSYLLEQNYPNPFNPSTRITYELPAESKLTLTIFNCIGEAVEVLVNELQSEGKYETVWNAESYPSGVYFYKLQAGSFIETKKMILMK